MLDLLAVSCSHFRGTVLPALVETNDLASATALFNQVSELGIGRRKRSYDALINANVAAQDIQAAVRLLREMIKEKKFCPGRNTYLALMQGYSKVQDHVSVRSTFDEMLQSGIPPKHQAYSLLLSSCVRTESREDVIKLLNQLVRGKILPNGGSLEEVRTRYPKDPEVKRPLNILKDRKSAV